MKTEPASHHNLSRVFSLAQIRLEAHFFQALLLDTGSVETEI